MPFTISHSNQLNKLAREYDRRHRQHNRTCLCHMSDAMMPPADQDGVGKAQENGLKTGLKIANALISSKLKNPKVYSVGIDGYTFYFVGSNVKSIIKRLGATHERVDHF